MTPLALFLSINGIRQVELAKYLGISRGTMSSMVNERNGIPAKHLRKIINNPFEWDVSMFQSNYQTIGNNSNNNIQTLGGNSESEKSLLEINQLLRDKVALLEDKVAYLEEKLAKYENKPI